MFKKPAEPPKSEPQGEDFDIFPDMGERYSYGSDAASAPEAASEEETEAKEEEEMSPFQTKVAALSDSTWKKLQIIVGGILGILAGLMLTVVENYATFSSYGLIAAVLFAMLIPNIIEKKARRSIATGRIALIIGLALVLGIFALDWFVLNPRPAA